MALVDQQGNQAESLPAGEVTLIFSGPWVESEAIVALLEAGTGPRQARPTAAVAVRITASGDPCDGRWPGLDPPARARCAGSVAVRLPLISNTGGIADFTGSAPWAERLYVCPLPAIRN